MNISMGIAPYPEWENNETAWKSAQARFPKAGIDGGQLWHMVYFTDEPENFMKGFWGHYSKTLANKPNDQANYVKTLQTWIKQNLNAEQIQNRIMAMPLYYGRLAIQYLFPEYSEWFQGHQIQTNLSQWMKDAIYANINGVNTVEEAENHAKRVKELLEKYGPYNWQERVEKDLVKKFTLQFFKEELQEVQTAAMEMKATQQTKVIGIAIAAIGGIFLLKMLAKTKK